MSSERNDDLVVMTHDGDTRLDPRMRQEVGMLVSDKGRYATELVHASPEYEFNSPFETPIKTGASFILRHDTPPPDQSSRVMNLVAPTVYKMAFQGQWKPSETVVDRVAHWKYAVLTIATLAFLGFAYLTYIDGQEAAEERQAAQSGVNTVVVGQVEEDVPTQPTLRGLSDYLVKEEPDDGN